MGYQPKYAGKRKPAKKTSPLGLLGSAALICLSLALTALLMNWMSTDLGRPKATTPAATGDQTITESLSAFLSGSLNSVRSALLGVQIESEVPEETQEVVVRQIYEIPADALVAPEPNQDCYGQTDDPSTLEGLLEEAAYLLDGQSLYFSTDVELFEGSQVTYYLDESIFAVTWKEVHEGSVYTFSEIKVAHASQFRRHLAGGEYGSDIQYLPTEMAASVNAVVASSGDFYRFRDFGAVVYQGIARRVEGTYAETCYIDSSGDLHFTYAGEVLTVADVQAFVDENDIQFSLAFGPVLVDNYELVEHTWYGVGEINEGYARAALCQMDTLHYIVVAANTEGAYGDIPTVATFAKYIAATGCKMAYCLDGGQTAAIIMNDELINRPVYGQQRKISDIIYFATAVPEGE